MSRVPFRLRVMRAITDQLKTITPANGYMHDLSDYEDEAGRPTSRVFRGRDLFGMNDGLPLISILEDFRAEEPQQPGPTGRQQNGVWRILIQGFVKDDPENPLDNAYLLEAEVRQALVAAKQLYNILGLGEVAPCVTDLAIESPVCRPADGDVSDVAYFFLRISLTVAEDLENPFA